MAKKSQITPVPHADFIGTWHKITVELRSFMIPSFIMKPISMYSTNVILSAFAK
jgi:hypothetical protein